jgi:hypothetical protein
MVSGPAADREASERSKASEEVSGDAGRLAEVLGFAEAMQGAGRNMQGNEQLAAILNNFARGSAGAGQAEIDSQAGRFQSRDIMRPAPSMLGDMFVGLSGLYNQYASQPKTGPYTGGGLQTPAAANLDYMGGGQGVRLNAGSTGLVMKSNLGIR